MTVDQFRQVNGFSNMFWGWGGEDDDMSNRLRQKKLYISRYPANIASKFIRQIVCCILILAPKFKRMFWGQGSDDIGVVLFSHKQIQTFELLYSIIGCDVEISQFYKSNCIESNYIESMKIFVKFRNLQSTKKQMLAQILKKGPYSILFQLVGGRFFSNLLFSVSDTIYFT